jgi:hypothetical protein
MVSLVGWNRCIVEAKERGWNVDFAIVYIEEAHAKDGSEERRAQWERRTGEEQTQGGATS